MRILVTGAGNPFGKAVVGLLLRDGHQVRVFGDDEAVIAPFAGLGTVHWYPGDVRVGGSIEPALSEREALVHVSGLDAAGKDLKAHATKVERGTLYARYGAEREQVDHFVHVTPSGEVPRAFRAAHANALAAARGLRGTINLTVVEASFPDQVARDVLKALRNKDLLGKQPGRETDAVTA